jgi:septal ring factor EnvC (AmiA/AmiB activator)
MPTVCYGVNPMSLPPTQPGNYDQPPYPAPPTVPPTETPARRNTATIVLAVLTVLLLLALAGVTVLYLGERNTADDQKAQLTDRQARIESLEADLKASKDEAAKTKKELDSTQACMKAVQDFFKALNANDEAGGGKAAVIIDQNCEGVDIEFF